MIAFTMFLALFQVKTEGTLELEHATGTVTITREPDNMIPHICAEDLKGALYGQGFANAQSRLFNMELMRRAGKGLVAEAFGDEKFLRYDSLMRSIGLEKSVNETIELDMLSPMVKEGLEAYAQGINDYVNNVGIAFGSSGHIFPVEFYAFNIEWRDWSVVDSLVIMRIISLQMSFSFTTDIVREVFRYIPELNSKIDELLPFRSDFQGTNQWVVVDDESL